METTAPARPPDARGTTNTEIPTRQVPVAFREVYDVAGRHDHAHSMGPDRPDERYLARRVRADSSTGREKWLYVFLADLRPDGSISAASLQWEGRYDDDGGLKTVDWSDPGRWAGRDVREATDERPNAVVPLTVEARSALGRPIGGVRTAHVGFLSHVQLPAARLDHYVSGHPDARLPSRALLLDPDAAADDGAFRSTLAGPPGSHRWVRWADEERTFAWAFVFDYVDFARTLHGHYAASVANYAAFSVQNAEKILHAGVTRSLADAYRNQEHKEPDERDQAPADPDWTAIEEAESRARIKGRVYERLDVFAGEVAAEADRVAFWAAHLYDDWMSGDAFAMAREDATTFGPSGALGTPALEAVEAEIARQADLLDGAEVSERGKEYLAVHLARAGTSAWYERVALATKVVGRITDVPKTYFEDLADRIGDERRTTARTVEDLHKQRLNAYGQLLTSYEHARAVVPEAAAAVDARQLRILGPMVEAVGTPTPAPSPSFGSPADLLGRLPTAPQGAAGPGVTPLSASDVVGLVAARPGAPARAGLEVLRPRHWTPNHTYRPFEVSTARYHLGEVDRGLAVLKGGGGRAFAYAPGLLVPEPGLVTPSGDPVSSKRRAVSRLLDVTGRPLSEGPHGTIRALSEQIEAQEAALKSNELARELNETRLNWAGKLFAALNIVDLVTGIAELRVKLSDADRDSARGASAWEAYMSAIGAGAGATSAALGLVESARGLVSKAAAAGAVGKATAARLGAALGVVGKVGAVLGIVSSGAAFVQEMNTHDEVGMWSAGFGVAGGIAMFFVPYLGIALLVVSIGLALFANTPVEDWLENSYWGSQEDDEVAGLDAEGERERLIHEVEDVFGMLSRPLLSVEVRRSGQGAASTLARYGNAPESTSPDRLRLTVRPGLFPDGSRLEVRQFRLTLPATGWGVFGGADARPQVPVESRLSIPDPERDVVVLEGAGAVFLREWDVADLSDEVRGRLRMAPAGLGFSCRVTLRLPDGVGGVESPSYDVSGRLGYARDYGTMVSVGQARPVGE